MKRFSPTLLLLSLFLAAGFVSAQPFQNGSFELGGAGPGSCFATLPNGSTTITGWTVTNGDIDWYGPACTIAPSDGVNSLDLVGDQSIGGIQQTFDTVSGVTYFVSFDLNGNFGAGPVVKPLTVTIGTDVHNFTFDTTGETAGNFRSRYSSQAFTYVALASTTTISFVSNTTGQGTNAGAVIDNVRVATTPLATAAVPTLSGGMLAVLGVALAGLALMLLRRS